MTDKLLLNVISKLPRCKNCEAVAVWHTRHATIAPYLCDDCFDKLDNARHYFSLDYADEIRALYKNEIIKKPDPKLYAFWSYDLYPYICGGEVTKSRRTDGEFHVETKEYGKGYWFNARKLMPLEEGKKLMAKIKGLECEYNNEAKALKLRFNKKLSELTDPYGMYPFEWANVKNG